MKRVGQVADAGGLVTVPGTQGGVAGVGEKKWQRRRFNVAVPSCRR